MDGAGLKSTLVRFWKQYKYAVAVALIGIVLMLLPGRETVQTEQESIPTQPKEETLEEILEQVLGQIQGAGQVRVLLSCQTGEETLYQTDTQDSTNAEQTQRQSETVILSDGQRGEAGLVRRRDPPKYLGAVVVCQGGDNPQVRLAIVEAVRCATGLGANQICVEKMK